MVRIERGITGGQECVLPMLVSHESIGSRVGWVFVQELKRA